MKGTETRRVHMHFHLRRSRDVHACGALRLVGFCLTLLARESVQGGSETSNVVRVRDGSTDERTGGGDGSGRVEDVTIFIRSDKNWQDQEWVYQRDSTGGMVWRENTRGKTEVVWTRMRERWWVYWEKDAEDGTPRKEETRKAKKEVYGCGEIGHGWGWSDGGGYRS